MARAEPASHLPLADQRREHARRRHLRPDLACVDRSLKAGRDSIVVAVVGGQMSIKRLVIEGNRARLAFDNPDLPAFAVEDLEEAAIWGVVRFTIRWHLVRERLGR